MSFLPDCPVIVFYLATEPFRYGFRWLLRQYGVPEALETGTEAFATEPEARKNGRRALIRAGARVPLGRKRGPAAFETLVDGKAC